MINVVLTHWEYLHVIPLVKLYLLEDEIDLCVDVTPLEKDDSFVKEVLRNQEKLRTKSK